MTLVRLLLGLFISPSFAVSASGGWEQNNGQCMVDSRDRLLPKYLGSKSTNTPALCTEMCGVRGYSFAGVNYGSECWCGNDEPPRSKFAIAADCNMECPGDPSQKCGGGWRMNVYKTNSENYTRVPGQCVVRTSNSLLP